MLTYSSIWRTAFCALAIVLGAARALAQADDHGNTSAAATVVTLNSTTAGVLTAGDVDYFRINVTTAGGTLRFFTTGAVDTVGSFRNTSDQEISSNDDFADVNFRITASDVAVGTYYLRVTGYSSTTAGAYSLRVEWEAGAGPDDHGNTAATATAVELNSTTAGVISAGDTDYFRFSVPSAGGILRVYTTGSTDTVGSLRNSSDVEIAANDDDEDLNFYLAGTLQSSGTFYIRVTGYSATTTGAYSLRLEWTAPVTTTDDHGNTAATATSLDGTGSGGQLRMTGALNSASDVDYFRFTVATAGAYAIYTTGSTDTMGSLRNSSDTEIAFNDDGDSSFNFRLTQTLAAGTYYVRVTGYAGATGSYTVFVEPTTGTTPPPNTDDHGNTAATATSLDGTGSGGQLRSAGVLNSTSDVDYFRFTVATAASYAIYTTGAIDTMGSLRNSNDAEIAFNDDSDLTTLNFRITQSLAAGTYYVRVSGYAGATGSYTLIVEPATGSTPPPTTDDHGNTSATATAVALNSSTPGALTANDIDVFRVTVTTAGGTLRAFTTGTLDTVGILTNSNGAVIASNDDFTDLNFRVSAANLAAGTYYVAVAGYDPSEVGNYSLRVEWDAGSTTPPPSTNDDHGNTAATATVLGNIGGTLTPLRANGTLNSSGDADYFRFTVTTTGRFAIYSTGSVDTIGSLRNAADVEIASNDDSSGVNFRIDRDLTAGNYYVRVTGFGGATGAYALVVEPSAATPTLPGIASRLANVSIRTLAGTGAQTLIVGFNVGSSGTLPVVIRAVGPSLAQFGVVGTLADPTLQLNRGNTVLATNDNWGGSSGFVTDFTRVGAFPLPATSRDAALAPVLDVGSYTAQIGGGTGVALVEVYDAGGGAATRLTNISARAQVGTGNDALIAGFVISGTGNKTVLLRAIGPTLAGFGVSGALANPQLALYSGAVLSHTNDNWDGSAALTAAFQQVGAFGLTAGSADAALIATLPAGTYSAQVTGVGGATGVTLVEIYELP